MLHSYSVSNKKLQKDHHKGGKLSEDLAWIDLIEPSKEEEKLVEDFLGIDIPTREEMAEIELSSRFYEKGDALYMTATILARTEHDEPGAHALTFILAKEKLVTVRYVDPTPFKVFTSTAQRIACQTHQGEALLSGLLDAFINRIADLLEGGDRQIDDISRRIFRDQGLVKKKETKIFQTVLKELGLAADLISKTQESLVSIQRLITFLIPNLNPKAKTCLKTLDTVNRDAIALREHTSYLIDKTNFLLDATLGLINIQQNDIMKLFSIVAVCFMPSTLVVGFFGTNFKTMPLLDWNYGFEFSLFLMIATLILSFLLFRRKGWL